ncbi:peptide ABC transporter ATPase [Brevibacterium sp. 5221]|uniref:Peptide ABC transporter ATPase n=1 Tax=Brevibacterium rongguiense TaxID=2695267 RepID=A0A6N9H5E4_9MICO|nr:WcbI family polysaccharide biosynthesis putative acetyltransferase [Brevibacterium rongguiense]MYM18892.1 peptide ABC transporter ATPase [Brevibacterium rongguiense]
MTTSRASGAHRTAAWRRHYGRFFGLADPAPGDRPLVVVHGNCQAGSVRRLLETAGADAPLIPPVHELEAEDLPHLRRLLAAADFLVAQPVRRGYRGLPIGTEDIAEELGPGAGTVLIPSLRFSGYFPAQATLRPAWAGAVDPPLVAYHDLRTLLIAHRAPHLAADPEAPGAPARIAAAAGELEVSAAAVARLGADSVAELARREAAAGAVPASDLLAADIRAYRTHHTLNHPANAFFARVVERVVRRLRDLGAALPGAVRPPDFEMLGAVRAALEAAAAQHFGLPARPWSVDGRELPAARLRAAQLAWYAQHPDFVSYGLEHCRARLRLLGWVD